MDSWQYVFILNVIFVAALCRSALGFGEALVAMPLLALILPARVAAPIVALVGVLTAAVILLRDWRHVNVREASLLTVFAMLAIPLGVWWLGSGDDRWAKGILAIVVLCFSSWSLWRSDNFALRSDKLSPLFGTVAGLLSGAYNTGGPPLVIFGTLRKWPAARFRATLQTYCLAGGAWVIAMHGATGLITKRVLWLSAICIPVVVLATFVGRAMTARISTDRFVRWVHAALLIVGVWLLVSCIFNLGVPDEPPPQTETAIHCQSSESLQ